MSPVPPAVRHEGRAQWHGVDLGSARRYARLTAAPSGGREELSMTTFDKRKDAFESKFAHDEELRFKAEARRNRLLGMWAAELLGKSGDDAEEYAKAVVAADFEEAGEEDVFRKVRADFDEAGVEQSDHQIRRTMDELMATAIEQIRSEP
jgi:hypothetical protein